MEDRYRRLTGWMGWTGSPRGGWGGASVAESVCDLAVAFLSSSQALQQRFLGCWGAGTPITSTRMSRLLGSVELIPDTHRVRTSSTVHPGPPPWNPVAHSVLVGKPRIPRGAPVEVETVVKVAS